MSQGLAISGIVNVTVSLQPLAAAYRNFGSLLLLGSTPGVIDVTERIRQYSDIGGVASDFGVSAAEYKAAELFFSQVPQPNILYIGRWAQTATYGKLHGGLLATTAQLMYNFTAVTSGSMLVYIDGIPHALTALDFHLATNLNGVASTLAIALNSASTGASATWDATYKRFNLTSGRTGAGTYAVAQVAFSGQPTANDTLVINGTTVTFVSGAPSGLQVQLGATLAITLANLLALLNLQLDANMAKMTYAVANSTLYLQSVIAGSAGNAYTLTASCSVATLSGATLAAGVPSSVSYAAAPTAVGSIALSGQPTAEDTITIDGTEVEFVTTSSPAAGEVTIGTDLPTTLASLLAYLNASTDTNLVKMTYSVTGSTLYIVSKLTGTAGNAYTLALSCSVATKSGTNLVGGSGVNVSALLGLTAATYALAPVPGVDAESYEACGALLADMSSQWYGLAAACATPPAVSDHVAMAALIEAQGMSRIHGITSNDSTILDPATSSDIASQLQALGLHRTFTQYSSSNPYAGISIFGRAFTVDFNGSNTTITLKFKQEPGVASEALTETQAAAAKSKNCNIFVLMQNGQSIIKEGTMANGYFFDEVHGTDWLQNEIQTDLWNLLDQSPTKIPQTDAGTHQLVNCIQSSMVHSVTNGLVAPGVWNAPGFGQLAQGDTLPLGYYVYAPPVASQSQADREARKSVSIQVAAKLAGAIHFVGVQCQINR